jgi:DNA-binding transcriptional LysR family regulator
MINTAAVEQAILKGTANIGFVEGKITSNKLELIEVDHDQPVMVASAKKWLSFGMSNSVINLHNIPWIVREKGSGTRKMLEDFINQNGLTWDSSNIVLELPSNESVREAVVAGAGATLISKHVVSLSIQTGLLKSSALNFSPRIYHMVVHKERAKTDAEKALIQFIHGTKHQAI